MPKTLAMLLFPDMDELDVAGPWEALALWTLIRPDDGWRTVTVSRSGTDPLRCARGLVMTPQLDVADAGPIDLLIHPGGNGTTTLMHDEAHLEWLRAQAQRGEIMASVCTGALVLGAAGVLSHHKATTHWMNLEELAALDPTIDVQYDTRYVDDGPVVTSAGVSAGIDMALHLVRRLGGLDRAQEVRRLMQYDPAPPV